MPPESPESFGKELVVKNTKTGHKSGALHDDLTPEEQQEFNKVREMISSGEQAELVDAQQKKRTSEWGGVMGGSEEEGKREEEKAKDDYDRGLWRKALKLEEGPDGDKKLEEFFASTFYKRFQSTIEKTTEKDYDFLDAFGGNEKLAKFKAWQSDQNRQKGIIFKEYLNGGNEVLAQAINLMVEVLAPRIMNGGDQKRKIERAGYLRSGMTSLIEDQILEKGGRMWPKWFFVSGNKQTFGTDINTDGLDYSTHTASDRPLCEREQTVIEHIFSIVLKNEWVDDGPVRTAGFVRALQDYPKTWEALVTRYDKDDKIAKNGEAELESNIAQGITDVLTDLAPVLSLFRGYWKERSSEYKDPYFDKTMLKYGFVPDERGAYHKLEETDSACLYADLQYEKGATLMPKKEAEQKAVVVREKRDKDLAKAEESRKELEEAEKRQGKEAQAKRDELALEYGRLRTSASELWVWKEALAGLRKSSKFTNWLMDRKGAGTEKSYSELVKDIPIRESSHRSKKDNLFKKAKETEAEIRKLDSSFDVEEFLEWCRREYEANGHMTETEVQHLAEQQAGSRKDERIKALLG